MKLWVKSVFWTMLILIGAAAIRFGAADDSPGLMLIGAVIIAASVVMLLKIFLKRTKW